MTEEQIERIVERKVDALDNRFTTGGVTQEEYDAELAAIDKWAEDQYAACAKR